jgi:hypothetical protein
MFRSDMSTSPRLVCVEPVKVSRYNRHRYGQRQYPRNGARSPHQFTHVPDRDLVPIPHRCHGYYCPPERVRDAVYLWIGLSELGLTSRHLL